MNKHLISVEKSSLVAVENSLPYRLIIGKENDNVSDPFLLLEHSGPIMFEPMEAVGAPDHSHANIEVFSYLIHGRIAYGDSIAGHNDGILCEGSHQLITSGSGVIHYEMPTQQFWTDGGLFEAFQLWINVPHHVLRRDEERSIEVSWKETPCIRNEDSSVEVKILAGSYQGAFSDIETSTPTLILDVHFKKCQDGTLEKDGVYEITVPSNMDQCFLHVYRSVEVSKPVLFVVTDEHSVEVLSSSLQKISLHETAKFSRAGSTIQLIAHQKCSCLFLAGEKPDGVHDIADLLNEEIGNAPSVEGCKLPGSKFREDRNAISLDRYLNRIASS